ncbi:SDR family NAD(P)-dependent oxidoreductase [Alphaproteobacteria bacterium]|nr:SDR family NAD(P)-dependent oxidoreductase [Alphaproteobacteria bacterium]
MKYKTAIITGASEGIGCSLAKLLVKNGWEVIGISRNIKKLNSLNKELSKCKGVFKPFACDVQNFRKLVSIEKKINIPDLLFLNAGIYTPIDASNKNIEHFKHHINVNYLGVINAYEAFLPRMIKANSGHIIIMSSISGWIGLPKAAAYGPTKAALRSFAQSIRYDLNSKGIKVQVCSPGFVETSATSINNFYMPGLIKADEAAKHIYKNMHTKKFEFSFPFVFSTFMKLLSILPDKISSFLINQIK